MADLDDLINNGSGFTTATQPVTCNPKKCQ